MMTIQSLIKNMQLDKEKVFINIQELGNTVSASIPIAIKDAIDKGKLKKSMKIILSGFGVGLSFGSIIIKI